MFTALVLICTTDMYNPNDCASVMSKQLYDTYDECVISLAESYEAGVFTFETPSGKIADIKAYRCINWIEEKA